MVQPARSSMRRLILPMLTASVLILWTPPWPPLTAFSSAPVATSDSARAASQETIAKVGDIVARSLRVDRHKVEPSSSLTALGADSLDVAETVMSLEECFNIELGDAVLDIELPTPDTAKFKNLRDLADLIQSRGAGPLTITC